MKTVGLVGWRGMVGSVLMQRMEAENDFADINPVYFTTSQAGQTAPAGNTHLSSDHGHADSCANR